MHSGGGEFVGLANFAEYFAAPAFVHSARNTPVFAALTTGITVPLAFVFAYAIQLIEVPINA